MREIIFQKFYRNTGCPRESFDLIGLLHERNEPEGFPRAFCLREFYKCIDSAIRVKTAKVIKN